MQLGPGSSLRPTRSGPVHVENKLEDDFGDDDSHSDFDDQSDYDADDAVAVADDE